MLRDYCATFGIIARTLAGRGAHTEFFAGYSFQKKKITSENKAFAESWSKGDAKAAASLHTEDAVRVGAFGDAKHGLTEIEAAYDRLLHHTMPGATVKMERGSIRMLTPEFALWVGGIEIFPS